MSYKKIEDRISDDLLSGAGLGFHLDDDDNNNHQGLLSQHGINTISSLSTLEEQNDRRASLSEPLTQSVRNLTDNANGGGVNNSHANGGGDSRIYDNPSDPYYVFRDDLYRQLALVDESLAEYLRIVYQTVRAFQSRFRRPYFGTCHCFPQRLFI